MQGEVVIYEAKLHEIVYFPPVFVGCVALVPCAALPSSATAVVALMIIAVCTLWCVGIYGGRQFILTSKRVIVKEGIQVEQSIVGRILNYGTLLVTTGEVTNQYKMIKDPVTFSTRINEQIDMMK